eukprot:RCo051324
MSSPRTRNRGEKAEGRREGADQRAGKTESTDDDVHGARGREGGNRLGSKGGKGVCVQVLCVRVGQGHKGSWGPRVRSARRSSVVVQGLGRQYAVGVAGEHLRLHLLEQLELLPQDGPHVVGHREAVQQGAHLEELPVIRPAPPGQDRDAVVKLQREGLRAVVHDHGLGQIPAEGSEVLKVVPLNVQAVIAVQAVHDALVVRVQNVHQLLSVHPLRSGEDHNLEPVLDVLHKLFESRPPLRTDRVVNPVELHVEAEVRVGDLAGVGRAMDESLVQIQHQRHSRSLWLPRRKQVGVPAHDPRGRHCRLQARNELVRVKLVNLVLVELLLDVPVSGQVLLEAAAHRGKRSGGRGGVRRRRGRRGLNDLGVGLPSHNPHRGRVGRREQG